MSYRSRTARLLGPLAERNADVVYVKDYMVLVPVRHVVRGVCLGMTSMKGIFRPYWILSDLITIHDKPSIEEELFYSYSVTGDEFHALDEAGRGSLMCEMMDRFTLPYLRTLDSFEKFYWHRTHNNRLVASAPLPHFRLLLALGQFDIARTLARQYGAKWRTSEGVSEQSGQLLTLLENDDISGIAHLLHESEADAVKRYGIERYWEPMPFPFESG